MTTTPELKIQRYFRLQKDMSRGVRLSEEDFLFFIHYKRAFKSSCRRKIFSRWSNGAPNVALCGYNTGSR